MYLILLLLLCREKEVGDEVHVGVRLEGTNVEQGRQKLTDSGLTIITADDLTDSAKKAVAAVAA